MVSELSDVLFRVSQPQFPGMERYRLTVIPLVKYKHVYLYSALSKVLDAYCFILHSSLLLFVILTLSRSLVLNFATCLAVLFYVPFLALSK